jgi:YihY family inner membrane protein
MSLPNILASIGRRAYATLWIAAKKFLSIDGTQWAAAFAHYAFFSLFPLIVLIVTIASMFIDRDRAGSEIIAYVETYIPIAQEEQRYVFDTLSGVIKARGQAGVLALLMLAWAAMRFFATLIRATNRAWGVDAHNWWRLPLASLVFLSIMATAILLSIALPVLARTAREWLFPSRDFSAWVYALANFLIPMLVVFVSLSLFYRLAPRRSTRFAEVWIAAFCATLLLQISDSLFVIYLKHFVSLNAVYGAFGGIMALLLWIYLAGCIFVFGACLCAARAELRVVNVTSSINSPLL